MKEALDFAQCLTKLMEKHQLTLGRLSALVGSRADVKQMMGGKASYIKQKRLYEKLEESHIFDSDDYEQLALSMEISRVGMERYRFQQAIAEILSGEHPGADHEMIINGNKTLRERMTPLFQAEKIEILCFNSCFHSLFHALAPLFADAQRDISMRHFIQPGGRISASAEYVAAVMPVLFDERYLSYYWPQTPGSKIPCIGGNQLLIRAVIKNKTREFVLIFTDEQTAYELPRASSCQMYSFISKVLQEVQAQPVAIKEPSPYKVDYASLCMTFLSHELNRATYYFGFDTCFQQTPTEIAMAAFRDKGLLSCAETSYIINSTLSLHEQRYQNQYRKKKPTYCILSRAGCEHFLKTGKASDHFVGFRPFTPEERKVIFGNMLEAARQNRHFTPLLLKCTDCTYRYNLVCYEKLGISINARDTDYDISKGYRSVFLMLPELTKQYIAFYLNDLVPTQCYSRSQSLEFLEEIYLDFLNENQLQN